jgi:hypothetical protein
VREVTGEVLAFLPIYSYLFKDNPGITVITNSAENVGRVIDIIFGNEHYIKKQLL